MARAYRSVEINVQGSAPSASRASGAPGHASPHPEPLDTILPAGFFWLPLQEVADEDLLSDPADWKKVEKPVMEAGVRLLYDELMPIIGHRPEITRDELIDLDRKLGRIDPRGFVHPKSLAHIYDVFFGGTDTIGAEQHPDKRWHINGRHRVAIAAELGQTHILARVTVHR